MRRVAERLADFFFKDHEGRKGDTLALLSSKGHKEGIYLCEYEREAFVRAAEEVLADVPPDWDAKLGEGSRRKLADALAAAGVNLAGKWLSEAALEALLFQQKTIEALNRRVAELLPQPPSVPPPPPVVSDPDFAPPPPPVSDEPFDGTYPNPSGKAGAKEKGHGA